MTRRVLLPAAGALGAVCVVAAVAAVFALTSSRAHAVERQPASHGSSADAVYSTASHVFAALEPVATPVGAAASAVPPPVPSLRLAPPKVSASAAVVMDVASGAILYALHPDRPMPPASLTKIATAILAVDAGHLNQWVTVRSDIDALAWGSSLMGLRPGDRFRMTDLLYGLMLPSGNDAAIAIADAVAGSQSAFVARMNALARQLGLRDTRFADVYGLGAEGIAGQYGHGGARSAWAHRLRDPAGIAGVAPSPMHVSSARDLAVLTRAALAHPEIARIADTRTWVARGTRDITMWNTNTLLWDYPGANGLKTGYTEEAGPTLAATAMRDGHQLIVVLLNAPQRDADATALLNWAFGTFCWSGTPATCGSALARRAGGATEALAAR